MNPVSDKNTANDEWTFKSYPTRNHSHAYHDYPARMIPQVAEKLINLYGKKNGVILDPYCGSGTSLIESIKYEMRPVGFDLNPLARLIAKTKSYKLEQEEILEVSHKLEKYLKKNPDGADIDKHFKIQGISDIHFWFKEPVIKKLKALLTFIENLNNLKIKNFYKVVLSETVRESSNTRVGEFKLYRYPKEKLSTHNPDPYSIFTKKLSRNIKAQVSFNQFMVNKKWNDADIWNVNSCEQIPKKVLCPNSVDLVVTSPPYGDSRTTVAYGQYSRLSSSWLGFENPQSVDKNLMGGIRKEVADLPSENINEVIQILIKKDLKRVKEVYSFYKDLHNSVENVAKVLKKDSYVCYVVGNRRVKGVILPTNIVVKDFFENLGFKHINTYEREIPNKRMPIKNSPTNVVGKKLETMLNEYIVVLQK